MTRAANADAGAKSRRVEAPLVWTFDNRRFADCLQDMEDTLRRAIVQLGDVSRVLVAIDLSLPALKARVQAGDPVQPAWGEFLERLATRYGLPSAPRVRYTKAERPLAAFVIAYRS
jgi:uncharacterized OB-fold protein